VGEHALRRARCTSSPLPPDLEPSEAPAGPGPRLPRPAQAVEPLRRNARGAVPCAAGSGGWGWAWGVRRGRGQRGPLHVPPPRRRWSGPPPRPLRRLGRRGRGLAGRWPGVGGSRGRSRPGPAASRPARPQGAYKTPSARTRRCLPPFPSPPRSRSPSRRARPCSRPASGTGQPRSPQVPPWQPACSVCGPRRRGGGAAGRSSAAARGAATRRAGARGARGRHHG
jgi:hypothetical protein